MYEVWVHTPDYAERTAIVCEAGQDRTGWIFTSLTVPRKENQVTELVLIMPYRAGVIELFPLDARLEVYEDGRFELETQWFVRVPPKLIYNDAGAMLVEVRAECALYLLAGRIVAYTAGSPQSMKSGPADNLIKSIVRENLGALALADRDLSDFLDVAANVGLGATVHKTVTRRNVLLVCQEIARASAQAGTPLFFDVVWVPSVSGSEPGRLEFRTYIGQRGVVRSAVLAESFGTLARASRSFDYRDEATVIYCAGQGQGSDRLIVSVSDDARRLSTPFNRREVYVDARYLSLADSVATEADATLWRRRPVQQLGGEAIDTNSIVYGYTWGWGDLLMSEDRGESFPARVYGLTLDVVPGLRRVVVELRPDLSEADDAVRRIEGRLDNAAPDELPVFALESLANAVPLADDDGKIDDDWLHDTIARISDIPTSLLPSGAAGGDLVGTYPDPLVAALRGVLVENTVPADGEVLVGNAGEWAISNVSGIKGVQETPAAFKVPLALSGGTIADGWLSVAIARLADVTAEATARAMGITAEATVRAAADTSEAGTRAAADSAHAGLTTGAHGGIVASTDARLSDARTPTAHAAMHQHGGSGEVATTTPAANAIPKAGSGSTLADGWLSVAIARLAATGVAGRLAFLSGVSTLSHDSSLVWDPTNKRLGIGGTPSYPLYVAGNADTIAQGPMYLAALSGVIGVAATLDASAAGGRKFSFLSAGSGANFPGGFALYDSSAGVYRLAITSGGAINIGAQSPGLNGAGDLDVSGRLRGDTFETALGNKWKLGGYAAGAVAQSGYVTVIIDGVSRRLLVG